MKKRSWLARAFAFFALAFCIVNWGGCSADSSSGDDAASLTGVTISGTASISATGSTTLTATPAFSSAADSSLVTYTWKISEGETYASISSAKNTVVVTGKNETTQSQSATVFVTATYNGVSKSATQTISIAAASPDNPENPTDGTQAKYTVKHLLQPVSLSTTLSDYEEQKDDEEGKTGKIGEATSATAKTYSGFTAQEITQGTIASDGTTVVSVYYDRNEITLTFDSDGGSEVSSITGKYGTAVTAPSNPTKDGYTFSTWEPELPETFPAENASYKATWISDSATKYTVKHFLQPVSLSTTLSDYEEQTSDAQVFAGETGETTNAQAKTYSGFTAQNITQATIASDGSTVVSVYYDRNTITLTFDSDGGSEVSSITGKYGTSVTAPTNPTKEGYTFSKWTPNLSETFPAENVAYKAIWTANTNTAYKVKHFLQPVSLSTTLSDYEEQTSDAENLTGTTGAQTSATAKTYSGFTAQTITQGTIASDGSTVVSVYYDRKEITLSFDSDGGSSVSSITGKYGTAVTAPSNPTKDGYTFSSWSPALPSTFPAENASYKATWISDSATKYTVKHYLQPVSLSTTLSDYVEQTSDAQVLAGETGAATSATAKTYSGFTAQKITQETIAADGSTVVSVYYDRDEITLYFDYDGSVYYISGKYGTDVTAPENPTKAGYVFAGWVDWADLTTALPETFPAEGTTYKATWTADTNTAYRVKHYQQNLDDDDYTLKETETLTGTTGAATSAAAKTYSGFTVQTISQQTIAADGSTVVSVYYDRNTVTITFDSDGGSEVSSISGKYGTAVTAPSNPTRTGYTFAGWVVSTSSTTTTLPSTFPAEDVAYKAIWTANTNTAYTVKHFLQPVSLSTTLSDYEEQTSDVENLTGTTGTATSAQAKTYSGFTAQEITQQTISGDGNTVVSVYYDRKEITLTLNLDGGSGTESLTGKYGTSVDSPANPTRTGYTFVSWSPSIPETFPAESTTYTATWKVSAGSISASAPTYSSTDLEVKADSTTDTSKITFTAKSGLSSYAWYVDGVKKSTESTFTMNISDYNAGSYTVMLVSGKNSATVEVAVSK